MYGLVIHGGAGIVSEQLRGNRRPQYEKSLGRILDSSFDILERGGCSLDAVTSAVCMLEDDPLFNAGCGSALTRDGSVEMDAAIMDGRSERAGAVAAVMHVKNPVQLARLIMDTSSHLMLVGPGAEEFALEKGMTWVANGYFRTEERVRQLQKAQQGDRSEGLPPQGTVGAVALDRSGNLASATSTGGMTNKLPGRVGDSPIIGAGTYAKNGVCAVSATGHGEYLMRSVAAYHIASGLEHRGLSLEAAVRELVHGTLPRLGGYGGVIAIDSAGGIVMDFNTEGMYRGLRDSRGQRAVEIFR